MYNLEIRHNIERIFRKLTKRNKISLEYISKKIIEIKESPYYLLGKSSEEFQEKTHRKFCPYLSHMYK